MSVSGSGDDREGMVCVLLRTEDDYVALASADPASLRPKAGDHTLQPVRTWNNVTNFARHLRVLLPSRKGLSSISVGTKINRKCIRS